MPIDLSAFSKLANSSDDIYASLTPEEEETLTKKLLKHSFGALEGLGWLLDTPGALTRGVLAGKPGERVSGRDLLTTWGITAPNDPKKWDVGDFAGFGAEIVFDPLTFMTMGASAATKAGQAFSKIGGHADDLVKIAKAKSAAAGASSEAIAKIGQRQARLSTSVGDVLQYGDEITPGLSQKFQSKLVENGIDPLQASDMRMGGLFGLTNPLTGSNRAIGGSGAMSQSVAAGLDAAGKAIAGTAPYRMGAKLFHATVGDAYNRALQEANVDMARKTAVDYGAIDSQTQNWLHELGGKEADPKKATAMLWAAENVAPTADITATNAALKKAGMAELNDKEFSIMQTSMEGVREAKRQADELGINIPEYVDHRIANYVPVQITRDKIAGVAPEDLSDFAGKEVTFGTPHAQARNREAQVRGGRARAVEFEKDKMVSGEQSKIMDDEARTWYVTNNNPDSKQFIRSQAVLDNILKNDPAANAADLAVRDLSRQYEALKGSTLPGGTAKKAQIEASLASAMKQRDEIVNSIKERVAAGDPSVAHFDVSEADAISKARDLLERQKKTTWEAKNKTDDIFQSVAETYGVHPQAVKDILTPEVASKNAEVAMLKANYLGAIYDTTRTMSQNDKGRLWAQLRSPNAKSAADVSIVNLEDFVPAFQRAFPGQIETADDVFSMMREFGSKTKVQGNDLLRGISAKNPDLLSRVAADMKDQIAARSDEITNQFSKAEQDILNELTDNGNFAKWLKTVDPIRSQYGVGLRDNHVLSDIGHYRKSLASLVNRAKAIYGALGETASNVKTPGYMHITEVLKSIPGLQKEGSIDAALAAYQKALGGINKDASHVWVPPDLVGEIQKNLTRSTQPETLQWLDSITRFQKAFMLLSPAYNVRNFMGGLVQNGVDGAYNLRSPKQVYNAMTMAWSLSRGKDAKGLVDIPGIAKALKNQGMELNDKNANAFVRNMMHGYGGASGAGYVSEVGSALDFEKGPELGDVLESSTSGHASRANPSVFTGSQAPNSAGRVFVPHPYSASADTPEVMVHIDPKSLDTAWQKGLDNLYIKQGDEGIAGRRESFREFAKTGKAVEAPRINIDPRTGAVTFKDGRHRFAEMRDSGDNFVGVMVPQDELDEFLKKVGGHVPDTKARFAGNANIKPELMDRFREIEAEDGVDAAMQFLRDEGIIGERGGLVNQYGVEQGRVRRGKKIHNVDMNTLGITASRPSHTTLYGGANPVHRAINESTMNTAKGYGQYGKAVYHDLKGSIDAAVTGYRQGGVRGALAGLKESAANPVNIANVRGDQTRFGPVALNERVSQNVEIFNRTSNALGWIMQGVDPAEAVRRANAAHVDYNDLSKFEKSVMRRAIPFYGFNRGVSKYLTDQLLQKPGGTLSHVIQTTNSGRADESWLPDYVGEGAAIPNPFSKSPDSYITGFGLMHEGPLNMIALSSGGIGPTLERTSQKFLTNANPFLKAIAEGASGKSMFTGRPFSESYQYPIKNTGDPNMQYLNMVLQNSPAGRGLSIVRKLGDDRKSLAERLANVASGMTITNLYGGRERAMEMEARKALEASLQRSPHVKSYQSLYVPKDQRENLTASEKELLGLMKLFNKRAKEAAKKWKEEEAKKAR